MNSFEANLWDINKKMENYFEKKRRENKSRMKNEMVGNKNFSAKVSQIFQFFSPFYL